MAGLTSIEHGVLGLLILLHCAVAITRWHEPVHVASRHTRSDIVAIYMNMPDRPARRDFAEKQYQALRLHAIRVEGSSVPDKNIGPEHTWLRALATCETRSEQFCLISEDDAVFRPLYNRPEDVVDADANSNQSRMTTASPDEFFSELNTTLASLPGGVDGPWHGLHLCTTGQRTALKWLKTRAQGNPWPKTMFSKRALMPGAPDVLLLRRSSAKVYASQFQSLLERLEKDHVSKPIDTFQAMLYTSQMEKSGNAVSNSNSLNMFVAARPQLCQHLADLTNDANYRTSRPEFNAPGL